MLSESRAIKGVTPSAPPRHTKCQELDPFAPGETLHEVQQPQLECRHLTQFRTVHSHSRESARLPHRPNR